MQYRSEKTHGILVWKPLALVIIIEQTKFIHFVQCIVYNIVTVMTVWYFEAHLVNVIHLFAIVVQMYNSGHECVFDCVVDFCHAMKLFVNHINAVKDVFAALSVTTVVCPCCRVVLLIVSWLSSIIIIVVSRLFIIIVVFLDVSTLLIVLVVSRLSSKFNVYRLLGVLHDCCVSCIFVQMPLKHIEGIPNHWVII